ncbi:MAG TPA: ABC transporter substrate-binding protein [Alphaproteobacteria bacterium]
MTLRGVLIKACALALLVAPVLAGPAAAGEEPTVKGDGGPVRLLYSPFGTNSFPPFVMQKYGLDKKHGFELQLVNGPTTQIRVTVLQAKGAELATIDWIDITRMRSGGVNVVGIAPFLRWGADFIMVPKDSPLQTIGDLKGKRVGTYSRVGMNWVVARAVAQTKYGLDLEKEASVQEAAVPLLAGLIEQGQLDATEIFNSVAPSMEATGKFRPLVKVSELVHQLGFPDIPYLMYAASADYAAAHPANLKAFVAAYRDAVQILRTDDAIWLERGREMKMTEDVAALFRGEARTDIMLKFDPNAEADIRTVFASLLGMAGPEVLGASRLPDEFMTMAFQ